ncbi:GIY-YIG nuclease family protein [Mesorhizobium sp. M7A.F.Ca.US.010.02.1.1]|uniref:GIY-YIG nuclease family protein n=1 Tax=unclassified Mesorhizobium TaxID=325217 RepID=UPI000FD5E4D9|nr:GIY-YIG nuclease family protein [Mesorhizobium sp. M7A.F.Ca.US.010.02.1.1]RUW88405.1 hypothetical protein EOA19_29750 [Mesorhizobium sp. M7A.F.Ca.US.010.02.1.1]
MTGYAYMTASQKRGTIYIGVTNDLGRRVPEHKSRQWKIELIERANPEWFELFRGTGW